MKVSIPGEYKIQMVLVTYNGAADFDYSLCKFEKNVRYEGTVIQEFEKGRFYSEHEVK